MSTTATESGSRLTGDSADKSALGMTGYLLDDLTDGTNYTVSVSILYGGGRLSDVPARLMSQPGKNTDNDTQPDLQDADDDNDGVNDLAADGTRLDNCQFVDNPDQFNNDTDGLGDACDPDDDNDGVNDLAADGTQLDNCQLVNNPDQFNNDTDALGDACDPDDDNDGFPDVANATTAADNCPLDYNPKQANADGVNDGGDACDLNDDNDAFPDATDVDDNGNGLIEIRTLDDLARLRDDLNGDGVDDDNDEVTTVGNTGCPDTDNGGCKGYELTRSLNFSDPASYTNRSKMNVWTDRSGSGWQPIGSCVIQSVAANLFDDVGCTAYAGVFDGRNYVIADLFISAAGDARGVGLFGAFNGSLQNVHLRDARINNGAEFVGGLIGYGADARFENLSVTAGSLRSSLGLAVGSMIGLGHDAEISHAYVAGGTVSGRANIGGLVGQGNDAEISHSYVTGTTVSSSGNAGGLGGIMKNGDIRHSYTADVTVIAGNAAGHVGGLIGDGEGSEIRYSYAIGVNISTTGIDDNLGGLVGVGGLKSVIHASYAAGSMFPSNINGGLFGVGGEANISYSYAAVEIPAVPADSFLNVRGLIGTGVATKLTALYWNNEILTPSSRAILVGGAGGVGGARGRTTAQLQSPTDFTGTDNIYADWGNFWCDPNTGDEMESETELEDDRFIRAWDLGTADEYPALTCTPGGVARQRQ